MNTYAIIPLLLAGAVSTSHAQDLNQSDLGFYFGALVSSGGDDLVDLQVSDTLGGSRSDSISAGGGVALFAGLTKPFSSNVELRAALGFHRESVSASNGDTSFTRFPVEGSVHFRMNNHQIGTGLSYILNPSLELDIDQQFGPRINGEVNFDNAIGFFLQYEYRFKNNFNVGAKYLAADYDADSDQASGIDGSYLSVTTSYRF